MTETSEIELDAEFWWEIVSFVAFAAFSGFSYIIGDLVRGSATAMFALFFLADAVRRYRQYVFLQKLERHPELLAIYQARPSND